MKKFATKKNADAEIREKYGWTQIEMAAYLGVSRSLLSLSETGERLLPSPASLKWLEWVKFTLVGNTLENAKAALQLPPPDTKKLLRRAADCEWEIIQLQRKLKAEQSSYDKALNNIAICKHLLATTPNTKENEFSRYLLQSTLSIATGAHTYHGPAALALLQCKIEGLQREAEKCREHIAALEKEEKKTTP